MEDVVEILDHIRIPLNQEQRQSRSGPYPYYGANGQVDSIDDFLFDGEHVLIAEDGGHFFEPHRGVAYVVGGKFWVNNHAHIVRCRGGLTPNLLVWQLNRMDWRPYITGTTRAKLTQAALRSVPVLIPPQMEQQRLERSLNSLLSRGEMASEAFRAVRPLLDRLRGAVLFAAFRGDLTADWRARNPDVEPANKFHERIRAEHRKCWEENERSRLSSKEKNPAGDGWKSKYREPCPVDSGGLPQVPKGWCWASVEEVFFDSKIGLVRSASEQGNLGAPYVRMPHFDEVGRWHLGDVSRVLVTDSELLEYQLIDGDVLFNTRNSLELVGKVAVWSEKSEKYVFNNNIMRLRASGGMPRWFAWQMIAPEFRRRILASASATTSVAAIYGRDLFRQALCVPPYAEQLVAIQRIGAQLERIDALASLVERDRSSENLIRSILTKAFCGELVPQNPKDEPAAVLLDRLRAEAGASPTKAGRTRAPTRSQGPTTPKSENATALPARAPIANAEPAGVCVETAPGCASVTASPPVQQTLRLATPVSDFLDLTAEAQTTNVHRILLGEGPLEREDAVRRAAELMRDAGQASFQRLRHDGTLATCIDAALAVGLRQGHFDRPRPGIVRAVARDAAQVLPALWRRALLAALAEPAADDAAAVRAAAAWSQAQFGLEFQRLRAGGHIDTALRAALVELITGGEVTRDRNGALTLRTRPG